MVISSSLVMLTAYTKEQDDDKRTQLMIGAYPCCNGNLGIGLPDELRLPVYTKEICPHCGTNVWHRFSQFDPESWTEAAFLAEHDVDYKTKTIKLRDCRQQDESS